MASYTALKSNTPGAVNADGTQLVMGLSFKVTSDNMQFDGWWWFCDIANGQGSAPEDFALWQTTGAGAGTYVTGSKVTSGTFVQGWNFIAASPAIPLTNGQEYRAVKTTNKGATETHPYTGVGNFFDTGVGSAGGVNGPLTVFAYPGASSNPEPSGDGQQTFVTPANDVTANYPSSQFNASWYGMDVQVSDIPPPTGPYRLFGSTGNGLDGPATATAYSGNFISGLNFAVKGGGKWFAGYWWWVCGSGQSTAPVKCALWTVTASGFGNLVPGSVVTSGTLTAGAWNYIPLPEPIQLAPGWDTNNTVNGSAYVAAIGCNGAFPDTIDFFASGNLGANGITNGPLIAYASNSAGTTNVGPQGANGVFATTGSDPAVIMPAGGSNNGDNFWVDVQINDVAPSGYSGSYRLYPNKGDANQLVSGDAAANYTIATEVHLTRKCTLNAVWYYRPNGASTMATRCDVWDIATGLSVASITAPTWLSADGSAFANGAHGIGTWAQAQFPAGVELSAGSYRVSVYNSSGTSDTNWSAKDATSDYFGETFHGAGYGGIDWGPIKAPDWSGAAAGYLYGGTGAETPPFSGGGSTPHAQPVFAQGATGDPTGVAFPQLNAPVGAGTNEAQNYFVDLEVTPVPGAASGLLMLIP